MAISSFHFFKFTVATLDFSMCGSGGNVFQHKVGEEGWGTGSKGKAAPAFSFWGQLVEGV